MTFQLTNVQHSLIVGAGHGIGLGFVRQLLEKNPHGVVHATYRQVQAAELLLAMKETYGDRLRLYRLDPTLEEQVVSFAQELSGQVPAIELVVNAVGVLHNESYQPEKTVFKIASAQLMDYFRVNAVVTPVLARYLLPLMRKAELSVFAAVSAKVGSISDNEMGGWHGYRASKAALNMFLKNIAIECRHRRIPTIVLSLHPGTTVTPLSEPFIKKTKYTLHAPEETAHNLLAVMEGKVLEDSGRFFSWNGERLPW